MPPKQFFKNTVFALSGKLERSHGEITADIEKHGGTVSASVTGNVHYLVSTTAEVKSVTTKVAAAQGRGIPIVTENFLISSVKEKTCLAHGKFVVKGSKKRVSAGGKAKAKAPPMKKARVASGPVTTTDKLAVIEKAGLADSFKVVEETMKKGFMEAKLTWDVELVFNDPTAMKDKFYNMQLVADTASGQNYTIVNWGKTGMAGAVHLDGPHDVADAKKVFRQKFRSKTGNVWGSLAGTFAPNPGKYRLLEREAEPEEGAPAREGPGTWQYYLHNKVDGKKLAWYNYDEAAGKNMEKYWGQFNRDSSLNIRLIQSDYFKYEVNFSEMIQRNTTSGTRRVVRRLAPGERPSTAAPEKIPEAVAPVSPKDDSDDEEEDEAVDEEEDDDAAEEAEEGAEEAEEAEGPVAGGREAPEAPEGGRDAPEEDEPAAGGREAPAGGREAPDEDPDEAETLPMRG